MMQPQGLGALMPQGQQQAPQMNNPRLNAAMDVVTSDAEEQILDPRTLAMLKYKDALQAMQAADQMMAAAQPQPMPPTVAERTKLAAEQGIAGLASRLSPGIQRQGNNMQAQQLQQAMSGGLPQLSAPNMARMAGGGIVAFQEGDLVEGDPIVGEFADGTPMRQSQYDAMMGRLENADPVIGEAADGTPMRQSQYDAMMGRLGNAGAIDETQEGAERRARYAALQEEGQQGRADILGAARQPIEIAPAAQESAAEPRGRGGYGLDEMFIDAKGGIASLINRARPAVSNFLRNIPEISEENLLAATTSSPVSAPSIPAPATAPAATPAVQAPRRQMDRVSESEAIAAMSPSGPQTAAEYLMAYGQAPEEAPRAGESASDRAARMRRLIAGLRGFGAEGLGGFAAGTAEEELRAEQEMIAEQERQRRAAMETRGLDLREREVTLADALRQQQADALQADREAQIQLRVAQLDTMQKEAIAQRVSEEAPGIQAQIDAIELELSNPDFGVGFFGGTSDREAKIEELRRLRAFMVNKTEEVMRRFGFNLPSAGGASGSTAGGFNPDEFTVRQVTQ